MIKQTIKRISQGLLLVPLVALAVSAVPVGVGAVTPGGTDCASNNPTNTDLGIGTGSQCAKGADQGSSLPAVFKTVANIMLFIVGAVAVIMLIIGGIRYVISNGDSTAISGAKNTILYAIIGIVVAFLAFAAVNFVTGQLTQGAGA